MSDPAQESLVAGFVVITFPLAKKRLVSLPAGCILGQSADKVDPVLPGEILQWPRAKVRPTVTDDVVWILPTTLAVRFHTGIEPGLYFWIKDIDELDVVFSPVG